MELLVLLAAITMVAGAVKGFNGFGYALVSTTLIATFMDPAEAVGLMILPVMAANIGLLNELEAGEIRRCATNFRGFIGAAAAGTFIGTFLVGVMPGRIVAGFLGVMALGFVASRKMPKMQHINPGIAGAVSGLLFGASNIGVQIVAYLETLSLDRKKFVGTLAIIMIGVSAVRVLIALQTGLYSPGNLELSILLIAPGIVGLKIGQELRHVIPEKEVEYASLVLIAIIGARLLVKAIGVRMV